MYALTELHERFFAHGKTALAPLPALERPLERGIYRRDRV
jgi:hypothetical protein